MTASTGPTDVLSWKGAATLEQAPMLRRELLAALATGPGTVTLDLSGVTEMDSAAVAVLVEGLHRAQKAGASLRLTGVTETSRRLLALTRVDRLFGIGS